MISLFVGQVKTNVQKATTNSIQIVQNNTNIPAQFHQPIIKGLVSSGSNVNSSQIKPQSVDLTQFAQFAPPQFREQTRASLKILGDQIAAEFKNAVISAFTATWIAAGLFALLGLIGAFFTRMPSHKVAALAQDGERLEEAEVPAVS